MNYTRHSYTALDKIARSLGLKGKGGHYTTSSGLEVDATACDANSLALGYTIARASGLITT